MRCSPLWVAWLLFGSVAEAQVTVGSKIFTESFVLSEILAQIIEETGEVKVQRRQGLGGTGILHQSIVTSEIDLYPEYSGTISEAILKDPLAVSLTNLGEKLRSLELTISKALGFNNTYALAVREEFATQHQLETVSDLAKLASTVRVRAGFSHEFVKRPDGLPGLQKRYALKLPPVQSLEHTLAYEAIEKNVIDVIDVYSTDAKIAKLNLRVLRDDKNFFPKYLAVVLVRNDFVTRYPRSWQAIQALEGRISESEMIRLNGLVDLEKKSFSEVAQDFLKSKTLRATGPTSAEGDLLRRTQEHLQLVLAALFFSLLVGLPLGVVAAKNKWLGQVILLVSGVFQTIPSLALLCFLIPIFGIGTKPALVALFLYGLLPIVTGVVTGIGGIDSKLIESARALGLSVVQRLRLVEVPLATPSIVAGIRVTTVISIGTATMAALIGAGGYGVPIVTGLAVSDNTLILSGAVPAALLALMVHVAFEGIARVMVPKGLR